MMEMKIYVPSENMSKLAKRTEVMACGFILDCNIGSLQ